MNRIVSTWTYRALALAALAGCTKQPTSSTPASAEPLASPPPVASAAPAATATENAAPIANTAPEASATAAGSAAPVPELPKGTWSAVEAKTSVEGCLAAAAPNEELGNKFPADTRSNPSGVRLETASGYVRVVHSLSHACCLKSDTHVERSGGVVRVSERLSGTPCRCRCSSAVITRLQPQAGDTEVAVSLEESGKTSEVYRGPLPSAGPAAPRPNLAGKPEAGPAGGGTKPPVHAPALPKTEAPKKQ
jgi:hypothetical protein